MSTPRLGADERAALVRVLEAPKLEVLPIAGLQPQLTVLAPGTRLTVTASPTKGLEASLTLAEQLQAAGFEVTVHLAARMVADGAHLDRIVARMSVTGLARAFVVAGDASRPGAYPDALSLLQALAERGHHFAEIGVAGYPQGHASIAEDDLLAALAAKAAFAQYMTTQLCFDAAALAAWLRARRADGIALPVDIGLPGAVDAARLLRVSARIGVGDAARFVSRQGGLVSRLLRPGGYRPDRLLTELAPLIADPAANVRGVHVFTFNQVDTTERWRQRTLASLGG